MGSARVTSIRNGTYSLLAFGQRAAVEELALVCVCVLTPPPYFKRETVCILTVRVCVCKKRETSVSHWRSVSPLKLLVSFVLVEMTVQKGFIDLSSSQGSPEKDPQLSVLSVALETTAICPQLKG